MVTFLIELMIFCVHIENKNDALKITQLVNLNRFETFKIQNFKKTLDAKKLR